MCTRPIVLMLDRSHCSLAYRPTSSISVPCGKCPECLKDRQNAWKLRLVNESTQWKHLYFFTLTYSEDTVPRNEFGRTSASVSDIQFWLKRCRMSLERKFPDHVPSNGLRSLFRYFIAAEYAPEGTYINRYGVPKKSTCRPHYHGVFFSDLPKSAFLPFFNDWSHNYGFYQFDEVAVKARDCSAKREERSSVANYISKYCCKGEFASRKEEIERGEIERAFSLMSKGIGENYVKRFRRHHLCGLFRVNHHLLLPEHFISQICSRRFVLDGAYKYKMPRYYIDRIYRRVEYKERQVWNPKLMKYESRLVKTYTSNSLLCAQISRFFEDRVLARCRIISDLLDANIAAGAADSYESKALWSYIADDSSDTLAAREAKISSKLRKFYKDCANRNSSLCVD